MYSRAKRKKRRKVLTTLLLLYFRIFLHNFPRLYNILLANILYGFLYSKNIYKKKQRTSSSSKKATLELEKFPNKASVGDCFFFIFLFMLLFFCSPNIMYYGIISLHRVVVNLRLEFDNKK